MIKFYKIRYEDPNRGLFVTIVGGPIVLKYIQDNYKIVGQYSFKDNKVPRRVGIVREEPAY